MMLNYRLYRIVLHDDNCHNDNSYRMQKDSPNKRIRKCTFRYIKRLFTLVLPLYNENVRSTFPYSNST